MKMQIALLASLAICACLFLPGETAGRTSRSRQPSPERRKPAEGDIAFATIDSGTFSGVAQRAGVTVRDEGEWLELWRKHSSKQYPPAPLPHVDFGADMVVAVFSGERASGGFAIQVERIKESGGRLIVYVSETGAAPGSINTMAITQPYHIVKLARSNATVVFQGL